MSDKLQSVTFLSIGRHTAQLILRAALDAEPKPCCGLIGTVRPRTISHAVPLANSGTAEFAKALTGNRDLQHMLEKWSEQSIEPCGLYFTTEHGEIPKLSILQEIEAALRQAAPALAGQAVILMPLMLNTAGCLEAFTYRIKENVLCSIPLILEEDGRRMDSGQRTVSL